MWPPDLITPPSPSAEVSPPWELCLFSKSSGCFIPICVGQEKPDLTQARAAAAVGSVPRAGLTQPQTWPFGAWGLAEKEQFPAPGSV